MRDNMFKNNINNTPILTTHNIKKNFGNIQALRGIDLEIFCGEILAIVGDNGSGKSTFIKILSGDIRPDEGTITIEDEAYRYLTSKQSLSKGISLPKKIFAATSR